MSFVVSLFFSINDFILDFENVNEIWGRNSYLYIGLERVNTTVEWAPTSLLTKKHIIICAMELYCLTLHQYGTLTLFKYCFIHTYSIMKKIMNKNC